MYVCLCIKWRNLHLYLVSAIQSFPLLVKKWIIILGKRHGWNHRNQGDDPHKDKKMKDEMHIIYMYDIELQGFFEGSKNYIEHLIITTMTQCVNYLLNIFEKNEHNFGWSYITLVSAIVTFYQSPCIQLLEFRKTCKLFRCGEIGLLKWIAQKCSVCIRCPFFCLLCTQTRSFYENVFRTM